MPDFDNYIEIVDKVLNLVENKESSIHVIENSKDCILANKELFKRIIPESTEGKIPCGIFVSYGIRVYVATIGKQIELLTHQDGYNDSPIFSYRVDDILDYSNEHDFSTEGEYEESLMTASTLLLKWSINPQSNIDIFPEIISRMIISAIRRIRQSIVGDRPLINILLPPFSKNFTSSEDFEGEVINPSFDFSQILSDLEIEDIDINFLDYSSLVEISGKERKYLGIYHSDGKSKYIVFSVFEKIRGHKECLGCVGINMDTQETFILQNYKQSCVLDKNEIFSSSNQSIKEENHFAPIETKLPIPVSCSSFLGVHTTSFIDDEYILKKEIPTGNNEIDKIISLYGETKSMSVAEICARFLNEQDLYNIALGDMVYIAILLEQHEEVFQLATLKTQRKDRIVPVQNTEFVHYKSSMLPHLPSNFARIGWRINPNRKRRIKPYQTIGYKIPLRFMVESYINHQDECTTDDIIEEYLFIHTKNKQQAAKELPNAISAAKMFVEILNISSISIDYHTEKVF